MKYAFVFPGQGSQSVGMLAELNQSFPVIKECFDEASEVLAYDLWQLVSQGPATALDQTEKTQPAMLAADIALWRLFKQLSDQTPTILAGHSLGEYSALVSANAISFERAVYLVQKRGELMQQAVAQGAGAMAAIIGLADDKVAELCQQASAASATVVTPANYNCPGQVVIAGAQKGIALAIDMASTAGAKRAILLPVSVPAHCALMQAAAEQFTELLDATEILPPTISVIHNVDVKIHNTAQDIRAALIKQLCSPVQWVKTIEKISSQGYANVVECGPGKVLSGLNRRINRQLKSYVINTSDGIKQFINDINHT